ncbi:hypothetical protein ACJ73_05865 [Blastomyces percursus]|uniref:Uncharacterized protein n=1 Tax=Blastomyces percursus TaxID=1658174 RepID=A0A1J9R448_9EURO|nr:hypothetical protein ACJ73_05865 [Blastomyces percursus]
MNPTTHRVTRGRTAEPQRAPPRSSASGMEDEHVVETPHSPIPGGSPIREDSTAASTSLVMTELPNDPTGEPQQPKTTNILILNQGRTRKRERENNGPTEGRRSAADDNQGRTKLAGTAIEAEAIRTALEKRIKELEREREEADLRAPQAEYTQKLERIQNRRDANYRAAPRDREQWTVSSQVDELLERERNSPWRSSSKRRRADTAGAAVRRPQVPKLDIRQPYNIRDMRELKALRDQIETFFRRHADYYDTQGKKLDDAKMWLTPSLRVKWIEYAETEALRVGRDPLNMTDFFTFLEFEINDLEIQQQDAAQRYHDARQRPNQTVREFADFLHQWEHALKDPYTESQRMQHLRNKVVRTIRNGISTLPTQPTNYEDLLRKMQWVENSSEERQRALKEAPKTALGQGQRRGFKDDHPRKGRHRRSQSLEGSQPHSKERPRKNQKEQKKPQRAAKRCDHCKILGHVAADCWKKHPEKHPKAKELKN